MDDPLNKPRSVSKPWGPFVYSEKARIVLLALLEKYADGGIEYIEDIDVLRVPPISELGTPLELIQAFGSREKYRDALGVLEKELY